MWHKMKLENIIYYVVNAITRANVQKKKKSITFKKWIFYFTFLNKKCYLCPMINGKQVAAEMHSTFQTITSVVQRNCGK